ncbi:hypothetical protein [Hazenella coriacea]|uniref:Uncharacterized protein n=1 Tax=Hazenella coriacea TaxID=1179467 RepID=A0A4R3L6S5_9BACL|nr:hypothetical protein [Hazenella coriacea]TCS94788.1 hypothetical protein EDD58_103208 [Hazenella coriacea]
MEESRLATLRKKQILYSNILYIAYMGIIAGLIISQLSAPVLYGVLGGFFILLPLLLYFIKVNNPPLLLFPQMKEIFQYEKEKLGENWRRYYTSGFLMQAALGIFFIVQAFFRAGDGAFIEGIPMWYFIATPIVMLVVGNVNLRFHIRRMDGKSVEQLKEYAYDKMLFSTVFFSVALVFILVGAVIVKVFTSIQVQ